MICLIICFSLTGCSYAMDWFEGLIMERASFSISADYDPIPATNNLHIKWSESPSAKGFAGYEVYMIPEPWNEHGTYEVIAARYDLYPSSSHFFQQISGLGSSITKDVYITVSPSDLQGPGEYYVRVGIIRMEKKDSKNDIYYDATISSEYKDHSDLESISGYKPVYIE